MVDDKTPSGWPLPHPDNLLQDDVKRLRAAIKAADQSVVAIEEQQMQQQAQLHQHQFEQFIGIQLGA